MAVVIEDGKGTGRKAEVNVNNELQVKADVNSRGAVVSDKDEETYVWTSSYSATSADEIIFVKNTSKTKRLFIDDAHIGGVLQGLFEVFDATGTSTQAGTASTGQNLNLGSSKTSESTSMGNAAVTAVTLGNRVGIRRVGALDTQEITFNDELILTQNASIAITYTGTGASVINAEIHGYFAV